ncbi:MAG: S9 family peptidase, partial [Planctomycetes bacterium]|nr:S9 family peptidase [Planctomycetota bacterium]
VGHDNVREGTRLAFGEDLRPVYHFDQAQRVLSLDANFFVDEPGNVRYARDFSDTRRPRAAQPEMSRLYVVPVVPTGVQAARVLTAGQFNVPPTGRGGYDWSPDCRWIVYTRTNTPLADDWTTSDLQLFDLAKNSSRMLLPAGPVRYSPRYSPDGKSIAFVSSPRSWAGAGNVHVHTPGSNMSRSLADTFDGFGRYSEIVGWTAGGDGIYFTEAKGTITHFGMLTLDNQVKTMTGFGVAAGGIHLNASRKRLGMSWETLRDAPEAAASGPSDFKPVSVSAVNAKLPKHRLGNTDVVHWKSKDGLAIEGLLTYPAGYKEGQRYPLLLVIHGGPMGVFTETFVPSPGLYPIAAFSSRGYAVLRPNPRGSSGYGKKFRYANYRDWGGGDYRDIMTGVDHVIKMGVADENRLGVMGWSYGGFMTSWIVTQTNRFKAASVGAGVTNLMSFTGTADIPSFLPDYFGGEFWDNFDAYKNHSAMFHVKGVRTPTLIQHGERDERVPLSQGLEFYNALKRQGCTTKMVIYPRTPHGIEEPRLLIDCMERNLDWFDRHVRNRP